MNRAFLTIAMLGASVLATAGAGNTYTDVLVQANGKVLAAGQISSGRFSVEGTDLSVSAGFRTQIWRQRRTRGAAAHPGGRAATAAGQRRLSAAG